MSTNATFRRANWLTLLICLLSLIFSSFVATQTAPKAQAAIVPTITEFPILTSGSTPLGITSGTDGNIWFTEYAVNSIGRIDPNGTITEFPLPTLNNYPSSITSATDGNIWFTEPDRSSIGKITPNGTITEFPVVPRYANLQPMGITSGPDGNLWFTEMNGNNIGRITPSGVITEFSIPTNGSRPLTIISGRDGNLWFTEQTGNNIGRITLDGIITEFPIPSSRSDPYGITSGSDGNIWFTEENPANGNKIGRVTPTGTITEFIIPTNSSNPRDITAGTDGNLWFTQYGTNNIGQITPQGAITELPIPTNYSFSEGITSGTDGNIWFTEQIGNKVGRVNIPRPPIVTNASFTGTVGLTGTGTVQAQSGSPNRLTLIATGLPSSASFKDNGDNTGTVTFSPKVGDIGNHTFTVTANDGPLSGTGTITFNVNPAPPTIFENFSNGTKGWLTTENVKGVKDGTNGFMRFTNPFWPSIAEKLVNTPALSNYNTISMKVNLHGATLPSGMLATMFLGQNGLKYVPLSKYVTQGMNGWQTITIPLIDFKGFDSSKSFARIGISLVGIQKTTIDLDDITFLYQ